EQVEKLRAKLQVCALQTASSTADRSGFDQGKVKVVERWSAKCVSAEGSKASRVWSSTVRDANGNGKKTRVVWTKAKIIIPRPGGSPGGREVRSANLVRAVRANRPRSGLLDSRIHGERGTAGEGRDAQQLPSLG